VVGLSVLAHFPWGRWRAVFLFEFVNMPRQNVTINPDLVRKIFMGGKFTQYRDPRYINPLVKVLDFQLLVALQGQTGMVGWSPVICC
jgi:hypothetical protein